MRKKILLLSTDSFLAYQPSIINLYIELVKHFDVDLISFNYYNKFTPAPPQIKATYLKPPRLVKKACFFLDRLMNKYIVPLTKILGWNYEYQNDLFKKIVVNIAKLHIKDKNPDEVIAVDYVALYAAQQVFGKVHLQTLEIYPNDKYKKKIDPNLIKSVVAPSEERYEYNFGVKEYTKFIIPNAPAYKKYDICSPDTRKGLIWAGTIDYKFGVQYVIEFIKAYPQFYLTLKGSFVHGAESLIRTTYADLIASGRLIINTVYMDNDDFVKFISMHKIAFCFYDWEVIRKNINYYLAPAGRLFMYYAAGVPTIACNTPGLKSIKDFNAGRLIDDYNPETIYKAVSEIENDYNAIAANCIQAAISYSFDTNTVPFINYLKSL